MNGTLKKLSISDLEKYLDNHPLPKKVEKMTK